MMRSAALTVNATPFFLPGSRGDLYAVYYPPCGVEVRGGLLYIPPFAEEAHCSHLVISAIARATARLGYGVLTLDLYGCGNSDGEFRDALWETWRQDLALGVEWLQERDMPHVGLWGLRLGGLLALDFAGNSQRTFPFIVLWHPPFSGVETLRQFLRLSVIHEPADSPMSMKELRGRLAAGACVEIIGWELNPNLASALERLELPDLLSKVSSVIHCVEFARITNLALTPSRRRILQACKDSGRTFDYRHLPVRAFWAEPTGMNDERRVLIDSMKSVLRSGAA